jgi:hypothetical protein
MGSPQIPWRVESHLSLLPCYVPRIWLHCQYVLPALPSNLANKNTVIPLFWFSPPELGGYGFSPIQISMLMGATGISQALWTLLFFPPLQRRWGTGGVLRACATFWPVFFALPPFSNFLLRRGLIVPFWIFGPAATVVGTGVSIAFSKQALPTHHSRVTL